MFEDFCMVDDSLVWLVILKMTMIQLFVLRSAKLIWN